MIALPVVPDGDEAREWAERELSDPVYDVAEPTWFDRVARAVADFFGGLFGTEVDANWGPVLAVIALVVIVVVIVVAFVVWGVPRSTRRAAASRIVLFGDEEERSAAELRTAAEAHAARGEWNEAIVVGFRALARGLAERGIVETAPGATVHAFARQASAAFPTSAAALDAAADGFDDVRYLRRPGSPELYARVAGVDDDLAAARAPRTPAEALA